MKFKLDENLPADLASDLTARGQDATTVSQQGLAGAPDNALLEAAQRENRVLLTLDKGIANVLKYPPKLFSGIVLFRPDSMGRGEALRFVRQHLSELLKIELSGRLIVVTSRGIRVR